MIDVTTEEFKQRIRNYVFTNPLIRAGIIQVVDEPLETDLTCLRFQTWRFDGFSGSWEAAADRIGDYFSRQNSLVFLSILRGVAGPEQWSEVVAERDNYRVALVDLFQAAAKTSDHTIALVPSSVYTRLQKQGLLSYHLCPFTQKRIASYEGKQLVYDDMCLQPLLTYPGEVKVFIRTPTEETKVDPSQPEEFSFWREFSVSVKGFEYVGDEKPTNNDLGNPDSWKKTSEQSRLLRVR